MIHLFHHSYQFISSILGNILIVQICIGYVSFIANKGILQYKLACALFIEVFIEALLKEFN